MKSEGAGIMKDSIWFKQDSKRKGLNRAPLQGDIERQALVIGAGMTGILTAYLLQRQGVETAVLEAQTAGSGQTGGTTAKITSQHGLIYDYLLSKRGEQAACEYAAANQRAIDDYERIIEEEHISCGFQRLPAYLYTRNDKAALDREQRAARLAGISCAMEKETELPFPVSAALRFDGQAQFQPLEFLEALGTRLEIYEHTPVVRIKGHTLLTERGSARGDVIIFACHFPFVNRPGYYFARMHQERSYVLALENVQRLEGMYYGIDPDWSWSFRSAGRFLLFGGEGHRAGSIPKEDPYTCLEKKAGEFWSGCSVAARWSAQDYCMPAGGIPFIGRFSKNRPDWYVAAGFKKWGMTHAMASARILSQMILDRSGYGEKEGKSIFAPGNLHLRTSVPSMARDGAVSAKNLLASLAGAAPKCPHLGCRLHWNLFEHTWECQCHGSRFQQEGRLLSGPAQRDLTIGQGKS